MLKIVVTAIACGVLFGTYAAFSAYNSGWLYDIWLLGFAIYGAIGATYGFVTHLLGLAAVRRLDVIPIAAFIGAGVVMWVVSLFAFGTLQSLRSAGVTGMALSFCLGAGLGATAYAVHVLLPNEKG